MKCGRCGRVLKNDVSIKQGYGRVCYQKLFGKKVSVIVVNESDGKQIDLEEFFL